MEQSESNAFAMSFVYCLFLQFLFEAGTWNREPGTAGRWLCRPSQESWPIGLNHSATSPNLSKGSS